MHPCVAVLMGVLLSLCCKVCRRAPFANSHSHSSELYYTAGPLTMKGHMRLLKSVGNELTLLSRRMFSS